MESKVLSQMVSKAQAELDTIQTRRADLQSTIQQHNRDLQSIAAELATINHASQNLAGQEATLETERNKARAFAELAAETPSADSAIARLHDATVKYEHHHQAMLDHRNAATEKQGKLNERRDLATAAISQAEGEIAALAEREATITTARNQANKELGEALRTEAMQQLSALEKREREAAAALVAARSDLHIARQVVLRQLREYPNEKTTIHKTHNLVNEATARILRSHIAYLQALESEQSALPPTIQDIDTLSVICLHQRDLGGLQGRIASVRDLLGKYEAMAVVEA